MMQFLLSNSSNTNVYLFAVLLKLFLFRIQSPFLSSLLFKFNYSSFTKGKLQAKRRARAMRGDQWAKKKLRFCKKPLVCEKERKLLCCIIVKAYEWNCSKQQYIRSSCSLSEKSHEIWKISIVMHECTLKRTFIKLQKESKTQELYAQLK